MTTTTTTTTTTTKEVTRSACSQRLLALKNNSTDKIKQGLFVVLPPNIDDDIIVLNKSNCRKFNSLSVHVALVLKAHLSSGLFRRATCPIAKQMLSSSTVIN